MPIIERYIAIEIHECLLSKNNEKHVSNLFIPISNLDQINNKYCQVLGPSDKKNQIIFDIYYIDDDQIETVVISHKFDLCITEFSYNRYDFIDHIKLIQNVIKDIKTIGEKKVDSYILPDFLLSVN